MEKTNKIQILKGFVVCDKITNLPIIVIIGNKKKAIDYIKEETSIPYQLKYIKINVII